MKYMKRADIKVGDSVERYHALMQEDISKFFLEPQTGELNPEVCQKVPCPLCGEDRFEEVYQKASFTYGRCPKCSFFYVNPRPITSALEHYYRESKASQFFQENIITPTIQTRVNRIFKPRLAWLNQIYPSKGKLLDIGCSLGIFLELAREDGWEPFGIEFSPMAIAACREKSIKVSSYAIERSDFPKNAFDIITLWEVLEHVSTPRDFIAACYQHLKPGGKLIVTVPNIEGIEFQLLGKAHTNIAAPAHLNYFSPERLASFLCEQFFRVECVETPGELDVDNIRSALQKGKIETTGSPFFDHLFLDDSEQGETRRERLQTFVRDAGLSGHLRVVAQKDNPYR
jgi:2-polyprenyl-3-methyl-5-hydroxy-6-metoxy-1,4-benzoquinol methylase